MLAEAAYFSRTELAKSPSVFLTISDALSVFMFVLPPFLKNDEAFLGGSSLVQVIRSDRSPPWLRQPSLQTDLFQT